MTLRIALGTAMIVIAATAAHADLVISDKPTQNVTCSGGVCTATAQNAVLNSSDLATMLASGDVSLATGNLAQDIDLKQALSWASTSRLTLDARRSIIIDKPIAVTGPGALTITTNDGHKGGDFVIVPQQGSVQFWDVASSLIIDGKPYELVQDIVTLAADMGEHPNGYYALAKSYDASLDGEYQHIPVRHAFSGILNGLGNSISNLQIHSKAKSVAFFATVLGTITDLTLSNVNIEGRQKAVYVAGVAGINNGRLVRVSVDGKIQAAFYSGGCGAGLVGQNLGTVANGWVTGEITGGGSGGLACDNSGVILDSFSNAKLTAFGDAGGLVWHNSGTVKQSHAEGAVSGFNKLGGLIGYASSSSRVYLSSSSGDVSGGAESVDVVGGLVGENDGVIDQSFSSGQVRCTYYCGGLVGGNNGTIANAYSLGQVDGEYTGGLAYLNNSAVQLSYSTGYVWNPSLQFGGLLGYDESDGQVSGSYWDIDTSGATQGAWLPANDPGITGLSDAQLKAGLPADFSPNIWGQSAKINKGYPYLLANPPI